MFERLGRFVFRHRRVVIAAWLVIILLSAIVAPKVSSRLSMGSVAPTRGETMEGYRILEEELGITPNTMVVAFRSETLHADDPLFMDEMDAALAGLQDMEELDTPITYRNTGNPHLISTDGHVTYATVGVSGDEGVACKLLPDVRAKLSPQPSLDMAVTGDPAFRVDSTSAAMSDMKRSETYCFPLIAGVLILVFGSLVAAGLPLAMGVASVVLTLGLVFFVAGVMKISTESLTVISALGLATGVDYSLIMVTRFREELRKGRSIEESLVTTSATSGKAIFYSAVTCVIGLATLLTFDLAALHSMGIGGSIVVLLSMTAGLTLLPALLAVLGPKVNRLTLFRLDEDKGVFWQRLARWEMAHPVVVLLVILPVLALMMWPLARFNPSNVSYTQIPEKAEARQGYEMIREGFGPGELAPIIVCVTANSKITDWNHVDGLYDLTRRIASNGDVSRVESIVNLDPSITRQQYELMYAYPDSIPDPRVKTALNKLTSQHATLIQVYGNSDPTGPEAKRLVASIRDLQIGGLNIYVAGPAAQDIDMINQLLHQFLLMLVFTVAVSYLALFWLFKSVLLPLKATLLNLASVAATFGILIFIFQLGHFSGVLGFTTDGTISLFTLVIVFGVVFGLSMDYEVFLLTRIKEEWDRTNDNTAAVALGLARTGRVITSAALLMVVIFGTFAFGDLILSKLVGLGLAIAILLDATVVRLILAPALMRVLGKWNWWAPSFLRRHWQSREKAGSKEPGRLFPDLVVASQGDDARHS